jgi:hypothetical protein
LGCPFLLTQPDDPVPAAAVQEHDDPVPAAAVQEQHKSNRAQHLEFSWDGLPKNDAQKTSPRMRRCKRFVLENKWGDRGPNN